MDDKQAMHAMSIDDAYHVERTLARGPSGVTELVSIDGNGPFVRKKIPSPLAQRNVWAVLSACQSNRLPRVEATYELPDRFVIVYDYVPGSTLAQIVEENGRLAPNVAVQLIDQICEAVQELHQHGVIHRDITPANIILARDGAHLIDFGIARVWSASSNRSRDTHGAWHLWFRLARAIWLRQNRRAFRRILAGPATRIHADRRISRCQRLRAATCR